MDNSRIGFYFEEIKDLEQSAHNIADHGYEFFIAPLLQPDKQYHSYCDLQIQSQGFTSMFVPKLIYEDLESDYSNQRKLICDQIDYSCYLGLPSLSVDCASSLSKRSIASLASIINSKLCLSGGLESIIQIWVNFNLSPSPSNNTNAQINGHKGDEIKSSSDCWKQWNQLRNHLIRSRKIGVSLQLNENSDLPDKEQCERWAGEPVKVLILQTSAFLVNKKGFPVLESMSYEVFEKDPVKYKEYQRAITEALLTFDSTELVLMVVGAGRGPLVTASIEAALSANKKLKLYAVEKNRNAMNTLNYLKRTCWDKYDHVEVEVTCVDMREFNPIKKADVIVSELLGSLGDNELSPECLDGLWRCSKESTISIPQTYTSYVAPIMSYKLHTKTGFDRDPNKPLYTAFENHYVVYLNNYFLIDEPKKLFTFDHFDMTVHPNKKDNRRFTSLNFKSKLSTVLHGFAGYFEATLYNDIKLSTVYGRETEGMFSWFPLWVPIMDPIQVESNQDIELMFWRNVDKQKVWFEWAVASPVASQIHNINARSQQIGL